MKKLLLIGFLIMNMINSYSQDIIDPPRLFDKTNSNWEVYPNIFMDLSQKIINERTFILGWNWGNISEKLDDALKVNYYHGYVAFPQSQSTDTFDVIDNARIIDNLPMASNRRDHAILNAFSAYFEPTITVDTTDNFTPRAADKTGAVFGWRGKNK
jgi:hypothetical protein